MTIATQSLLLVSLTHDEILLELESMPPEDRRHVSPEWLALLKSSSPCDPWIHGFVMTLREDAKRIGRCGFTGPPGSDGVVEIAYGVDPEFQLRGFATEAAKALIALAVSDRRVRTIRAHTMPRENASARVLTKCGLLHVGERIDHEIGMVWRWERPVGAA